MKTYTSSGIPPAANQSIELLRGLCRRDEQLQEAAALMLLLGNELVRRVESGESHSDHGFSSFIACGLVGISQKAAQQLHQATQP